MSEREKVVAAISDRTHIQTGYWCPYCGTRGKMWQERGPGDYYVGPTTICAACGAETDRLEVWRDPQNR